MTLTIEFRCEIPDTHAQYRQALKFLNLLIESYGQYIKDIKLRGDNEK